MEGLAQMIDVIRQVMDRQPGRLRFGGIVLTMYDPYLELTREVEQEVRDFFGEIVYSDGDSARRDRFRGPQPRPIRDGLCTARTRGDGLRRTLHGGART